MSLLQLGSIELQGFELPSRVVFGGAQQLAVHKLIGGVRVIDALGRDDASLEWSGVLSGSSAADRARNLDALRVAGKVQNLTWDAFCYSVLIARLRLEFRSPWWIPYRISCVVQRDLAQGVVTSATATFSGASADLASAQQFLNSAPAAQLATASALLSSQTASSAMRSGAIAVVQHDVAQGIEATQVGLESDDMGQIVSSAGLLAQLCCARGFLNRSKASLAEGGA